jgi:hypothetical protein
MSGLAGRGGFSTGKYEAELSLIRKWGEMAVKVGESSPGLQPPHKFSFTPSVNRPLYRFAPTV